MLQWRSKAVRRPRVAPGACYWGLMVLYQWIELSDIRSPALPVLRASSGFQKSEGTMMISSSASWPWSLCRFWEALAVCTFMTPFRKQTSPNYSSSKFKETNAADKGNTSWECGRPCPLEFWILLWSEINSNSVITYHSSDNVSLWLNISKQCECVCLPHIQGHSGRVHSCI